MATRKSNVGNALNKVGSVTTKIGIFMGSLFSLIYLLITLYIAKKIKTDPYRNIKATIKDSSCKEDIQNVCTTKNKTKTCKDEVVYKCKLNLQYNVKKKKYLLTSNLKKQL